MKCTKYERILFSASFNLREKSSVKIAIEEKLITFHSTQNRTVKFNKMQKR